MTKRIYGDVVATGRTLGVAMQRLEALGSAVEAWTGSAVGSTRATSREPIAGRT